MIRRVFDSACLVFPLVLPCVAQDKEVPFTSDVDLGASPWIHAVRDAAGNKSGGHRRQ